jgi:serine/threonine-protein kinase
MIPAMREFIAELKRRKVIRIAIAYLAAGWVILQVASMVIPAFDIPGWTLRLLVVVVALGLPLALVLGWFYELTPDGLVRETPVHSEKSFAAAGDSNPVAKGSATASVSNAKASSIAVLPFADMSQARDQEFFSDGLSEELINLLAKVPGLHVAGRTSSFSFKGKDTIITDVGIALNVAHVLEGSVRKVGDHLRITAQLINVADDFHLWSETYDRQLTDIFVVQDEIASAVVDALKLKLLPGQLPTSSQHHTPGPDAYSQFLQGRHYLNRGTPDGFRHAVEAYGQAVKLEPEYAMAYAGLALAQYADAGYSDDTASISCGQKLAMAAAEQAVAHDPRLADAYAARGYLRGCYSWDWSGAQADFAQALALNPADETTYERYGRLLASLGKLPEAIAAARKPIESDPLSARAWYVLGRFEAAHGDLTQARQSLNRAMALAPEHAYAPLDLGLVSLLEGNPAAAFTEFMRVPNEPFRLAGVAMAEHDLGHPDKSQQALDALIGKHADGYAYQIAETYAWRDEPDEAFAWLERASAQRDAGLQRLKYDPALRKIGNDPRYRALLEKLGLPL